MTETAVRNILERQIRGMGSQRAWAKTYRVSPQHVSDTLLGRRELGPKILDALGIERVVGYKYKGLGGRNAERTATVKGR